MILTQFKRLLRRQRVVYIIYMHTTAKERKPATVSAGFNAYFASSPGTSFEKEVGGALRIARWASKNSCRNIFAMALSVDRWMLGLKRIHFSYHTAWITCDILKINEEYHHYLRCRGADKHRFVTTIRNHCRRETCAGILLQNETVRLF